MTVLLLDVMDTIVWDPYRLIPGFFDTDWRTLMKGRDPSGWVRFETGEIDEAAFLDTFFGDGREYDRDGLRSLMWDNYRWLDGMEELLGELLGAGVPMHALSNYPDWYLAIEERLGLGRYLEWSFVSCRTGVRKPDPRAYLGPAEALGRPPGELLFVDDRESNVAAAREAGLQGVRFESAEQLRRDLVARGVLQPRCRAHPAIRFRPLLPSDSLEELTALLHRAYARLAAMGLRFVATHQDVAATAERVAEAETWVGVRDGALVATVGLVHPDRPSRADWYRRPDVAHVHQFAVDPSLQGVGVGSALMELVEGRARSLGAAELAMDTSEQATHLLAWYGKRGYRKVSTVDWGALARSDAEHEPAAQLERTERLAEQINYRSVILSRRLDGSRQ